MPVTPQDLETLLDTPADQAWKWMQERVMSICSVPLELARAKDVVHRDRMIGELDTFLGSCAWELWQDLESSVESTATRLNQFWLSRPQGRAVLILDGLSLREIPWLVQGATGNGFQAEVHTSRAELPAETNAFAKAIGIGQRSNLQNNGLGLNVGTLLPGARTETTDLPFADCASLVDSHPDWLFWHQWPDVHLHEHDNPGQGLATFEAEIAQRLLSSEFWLLVRRLAQGRKLILTSDHGYAATGFFNDAESSHKEFLKETFRGQRFAKGSGDTGSFVPPVALELATDHGPHRFSLGRWKWKSQGGFPTLAHGGLTLLEVFVPWVEITQNAA